ncbi:hypothetical protein F8M41_015675 [Gigaspora margarita]|uniref:Uncharacterized protein n=1 Tax=Gigaspora margarita TaxID=4874 RepID=A0A8H4AQI4_GIGMA|nr:hypothetical protein F8M41_015675 [Gigaspora margarita]
MIFKNLSFELVLSGLKLSFRTFIEHNLPIVSNYGNVETFEKFLEPTNNRIVNERKDLNVDIHGWYELLVFLIQSKWLKSGSEILVKDMREFMTTISTKPLNNVGF